MSVTRDETVLVCVICFGVPIAVILFGCMWLSYYEYKVDRKHIENALSSHGTTAIAFYLRLCLSVDDCMDLYNKTFDSNGNQLTLQSTHIVTEVIKKKPTTTTVTEIVEDIAPTSTIESSSFVDIELGSTDGNNNDDHGVDNDDDDDVVVVVVDVVDDDNDNNCDVDDIVDIGNSDDMDDIDVDVDDDNDDFDDTTTTTTTSIQLDHNHEQQQPLGFTYNGTCIICLEEFVTNDVIVWSADPSCRHIYHKTCMVQYLASNANNTSTLTRLSSNLIRTLDVINNPCPTCRRQKFCSIRDEHIVQHYNSKNDSFKE